MYPQRMRKKKLSEVAIDCFYYIIIFTFNVLYMSFLYALVPSNLFFLSCVRLL